MSEFRIFPDTAAVAVLAGGRKTNGTMVGISRSLIILGMAGITGGGKFLKASGPMTGLAVKGPVSAFEPKASFRFMIPAARIDFFPGLRRMALAAPDSQAQGIPIILTPFPMADLARGRSPFENVVDVAIPAAQRAMFALKGEVGPVMGFCCPLDVLVFLLPGRMGMGCDKNGQNEQPDEHDRSFRGRRPPSDASAKRAAVSMHGVLSSFDR